jgi:2-polyprenyl-3-methyl-5-hydroxy-6-metoxy-1,4-benzoquinol methylase
MTVTVHDGVAERLLASPRDRDFFRRVWATPGDVYEERLRAVGFAGLGRVLDAGCGFGQWTLALARLNAEVVGVDASEERVAAARAVAASSGAGNVSFRTATLEGIDDDGAPFDAVFSYSVVQLTDYRASLRRLHGLLAPGGLLYVNTNGLGWYVYNLLETHNDSADFSSRGMALEALENTVDYFATGAHAPGRSIVLPSRVLIADLAALGFEVLAHGPDASIRRAPAAPRAFFDPAKYGHESVYEVLARRR